MDCRIVTIQQGTDEWLDLRRGRITCSRLGDVMAKPTTKRYQTYMREKVLELLGHTHVEEAPEWARHGRENEPKAIRGYEWKYGIDVVHDVFLIHKKYDWLSCSPDLLHLPQYDEGGEVKCRALYKSYRAARAYAENNKGKPAAAPAEYRHQIQGAMWVTGFSFWWYINYYVGDDLDGGMTQKIHRIKVPRDQGLIDKMEESCKKFITEAYDRAGLDAPSF
jgi:hypothetical protein